VRKTSGEDLATLLAELEEILGAQVALHGRVEASLAARRETVRRARIDELVALCGQEQSLLGQLSAMEKTRLSVMARLASAIGPRESGALTLARAAEAAAPEQRDRLLALRDELRERAARARRESTVVRAAMDALNRHMVGILQTVRSALSGARVYERRGQVALGAQLDFSVDVRS